MSRGIEHLPRVVPEAPGRPDPMPIAPVMQRTTREIAYESDTWTSERREQIAALFDSLARGWSQRASELRRDALEDAFARGGIESRGLALEVGSGTGIFTPWLAERLDRPVAVDISLEMLRLSPPEAAPRVCADAADLPVRDGAVTALVLVNCFLFPGEVDRVLATDGALVWVSTIGDRTPIYLGADEVAEVLPGPWRGVTSEAGWGTWAVLRRR